MTEEIDISHLFAGWDRILNNPSNEMEYEDNTPLEEYFTVTNLESVTSYYMTVKGHTEKYTFDKLALLTINETGGFFSPKKFTSICNEYGIKVKSIPKPENLDEILILKSYSISNGNPSY